MKIVFMGTPEFAVPCLQKIIDEGHEVLAVVTQPDKPKGRGKKLAMPPVKELALKYNIDVYQPVKAREDSFVEKLKEINPELIVVVAFGQILPKSILDIPKFGCVNVHASLLPKYRGAAPLNWVIINGEEKTGVTTMYMDVGLDTGDMILKSEIPLDDEITAGELHDKMMVQGAEVLKDTIDLISKGEAPREKQNDEETCYSPIMDKSLGNIDWSKSATDIHNLIRGVNPWPSAYTTYYKQTMKIWKTKVLDKLSEKTPGTILSVDKNGIEVSTGDKVLQISEIQMSGKKRMIVSEYIKGNDISTGIVLGI
ncbi:methionyl-tRNA formyltransferase,Methionyl-tRNA formyltransferase,methionyl-tRNA formyltransferase,Folate-dependent phosphoribosylglycinamide formyltransferase PurN,methionyl-tRNA formyltransferase,Formyl transferase [[Clostridium] sordellii]|uniref:methionyl-tRNA formyltransferase n=1 Tax=Paraclostridium sordellii TaxID=1505 RepID=UPI0005443F79|nr:methionyl-tRNA formyltransferase [Paeniclostridium sordellii]CEK35644.1 methionyl-tRNA formyltransferase,Methionyl-tRNA formyltransferase,methionyl-tRNA formyltransferase,Folate-dependent phosphoribosylglycinamide formyltransferase PurN,methionyl-tRNA formyltransferase,Formyl transferase [[Clostridium] sordellii] [Paeniclostridium sordellii]